MRCEHAMNMQHSITMWLVGMANHDPLATHGGRWSERGERAGRAGRLQGDRQDLDQESCSCERGAGAPNLSIHPRRVDMPSLSYSFILRACLNWPASWASWSTVLTYLLTYLLTYYLLTYLLTVLGLVVRQDRRMDRRGATAGIVGPRGGDCGASGRGSNV